MIPPDAKATMQGAAPSLLATCNPDGTPNITHISQVWYVDETHVALSFQFFNKTAKNVRENPYAAIRTFHPKDGARWAMDVKFVRSETEGETFDAMEMQLEAIASMTGMEDVFQLKAADIYDVLSIERVPLVPDEVFA
jgi:predicted pyridoxine 5'-phosphate oxidase superfamily flavin-nucleotide-binding protein